MSPPPLQRRRCAVCGGSRREFLFRQQFSAISGGSLLDGYDVVTCERCGFCFADPLPPEGAFSAYYRELSKYEHGYRGGEPSEYELRRFAETVAFVSELVPDRAARILDVGCANGGQLAAFAGAGFRNLLGLDPSPSCALNARRLYGVPVVTADLQSVPPDVGEFDVVILGAVLEHVPDPSGVLRRVGALLRPGGLVHVEVPDASRFSVELDAPYQEFSVEHVNYFAPASLGNLLGACNFAPLRVRRTAIRIDSRKMAHELRADGRLVPDRPIPSPRKDEEAMLGIRTYVEASRIEERQLHGVVDRLVASARPVIVWGVGTHTQRLLATSLLGQANIVAFVDSNPRYEGKMLHGCPILAPGALAARREPILISSCASQGEIRRQIEETLKLPNEIIECYET